MMYKLVADNTSGYALFDGEPFSSFDTLEEFKYQMEKYFSGIWNFRLIAQRKGDGSRAENLVECTFNLENGSNHRFYFFLCQIEGGGRSNLPREQRIQFRTGSQWNPALSSLNIAHKFSNAEKLDNVECYFIGIYKRSNSDHDVAFVGVYPNWIHERGIETTATSNVSFQVNIEKIQEAFLSNSAIHTKTDGQRAICFKPNKLIWYMKNRDLLHLGDLNKIENILYKKLNVPASKLNYPLQLIFYGAPGTGKSFATNDAIENYPAIRTTFHPDSDYSTFVGAYKPTMGTKDCYGLVGRETVRMEDVDGKGLTEETINYKFIKQAFLKAYVNAWKLFVETYVEGEKLDPQFLIIEEINRGNCAQIFGDIFQLLDRKNGFSEYPIEADEDIRKSLLEDDTDDNPSFGEDGLLFTDEQKTFINAIYDKEEKPSKNIADKIAEGKVLVLPPNMYIWATMNTSDQSLFPMDSAFKRRWEWKYIPIEQADGDPRMWKIKADNHYCYWWEFLQAINDEIEDITHSEDKQLGYYFCKPKDGEYISAKDFVSKVIFYLWNDIFKDEDSKIFEFNKLDGDWDVEDYKPKKDKLYFRSFITGKDSVDEKLVRWFINNLLKNKEVPLIKDGNNGLNSDNAIAYMREMQSSPLVEVGDNHEQEASTDESNN